MKKSGFFNSTQETTDRSYQAIDFALPLGALVGGKGGIMMGVGDSFKYDWVIDGVFTLGTGFAFCGEMPGWWYYSDVEETITLHDAQSPSTPCFTRSTVSGQDRTNILAIEMDGETNREVSLVMLPGPLNIAEDGYDEPSINNNDGYDTYYVPIAKVVLNTTKIISVTDIRETTVGNNCLSVPKDESEDPLVRAGYCGIQQVEDEDTDDSGSNDIFKGEWIESYNGIGISDGERLITQGLCNIEDSAQFPDGLDWPVTYYVQQDGKIGRNLSKKVAGYSLSENMFLVNLQGPFGQSDKFEEEMTSFNAISGTSNCVRFKLGLPEEADGIMLRYKTDSAWTLTDDAETGILIGEYDLEDVEDYSGINKWKEIEIFDESETPVANRTVIYVRAFPRKLTSFYEEFETNEQLEKHSRTVTVGILEHEWTADDIGGLSKNSVSSNDLNCTNIGTDIAGQVGEAMIGTSGEGTLDSEIDVGGKSISFWVKPTGTNTGLFGGDASSKFNAAISSNILKINTDSSDITLQSGNYYHVVFKIEGSSVAIYKNTINEGSEEANETSTITTIGKGYHLTSGIYTMNCSMDQIRIFDGMLTTDEIENLYNGGDGC